jgi:hypothetical protein
MPVSGKAIIAASVLCLVAAGAATVSGPVGRAAAQSGREREARPAEASLNVIVQSDQGVTSEPLQLTPNQCALYEAGIQQEILSLRPDLSAARIVLLVDNSQNVGLETSEMEATTRALIRELFTGDQLMIIGYGAENVSQGGAAAAFQRAGGRFGRRLASGGDDDEARHRVGFRRLRRRLGDELRQDFGGVAK